jgi:hypothetical protein
MSNACNGGTYSTTRDSISKICSLSRGELLARFVVSCMFIVVDNRCNGSSMIGVGRRLLLCLGFFKVAVASCEEGFSLMDVRKIASARSKMWMCDDSWGENKCEKVRNDKWDQCVKSESRNLPHGC